VRLAKSLMTAPTLVLSRRAVSLAAIKTSSAMSSVVRMEALRIDA